MSPEEYEAEVAALRARSDGLWFRFACEALYSRETCREDGCPLPAPPRGPDGPKRRRCVFHDAQRTAAREAKESRKKELSRLDRRLYAREREELAEHLRPLRDARRIARAPRYSGPPRRAFVYLLRDHRGELLYVGKTISVEARLFRGPTCHAADKPWFCEVATVEVRAYPTEADAFEAEALLIQRLRPPRNKVKPKPKGARLPRKLAAYSGAL